MINSIYKNLLVKTFISTVCLFTFSCENDMKDVQALGEKRVGQEVAENIVSYLSQDAVVKAKLTSPLMLRTDSDTTVVEFPKTLHVDFYDSSTNIESRLFAKYGRYLENQGKVLLKDSVVVFNVKGDTLLTDELWWDRNKEIFYTDKKVVIKQPFNQILNGENGMEADQSFKTFTLFNGSGLRNLPANSLPD